MTCKIGIYVFENVEVLDFAGPYEVFTCATRVNRRDSKDKAPAFEVFTVGETLAPIYARAGLRITPDYDFTVHPGIDVLVVAGGVVEAELDKPQVIDWIMKTAQQTTLTASVCTGAFLLAKAGLLQDKQVTTHWEDQSDLQNLFPGIKVLGDCRWVDEGSVVTSGGISAGIDMSLHIVERLMGRNLAERTACQMEFDWIENPVI